LEHADDVDCFAAIVTSRGVISLSFGIATHVASGIAAIDTPVVTLAVPITRPVFRSARRVTSSIGGLLFRLVIV
jgi:hypothetical protein